MKSVGPFQAAAPALADAGRPVRAKTRIDHSSQFKPTTVRETLAHVKPTGTTNRENVQVQRGDTLTGLTRKYLHVQGQAANASEVHRMAMTVAKNNSLTNPNLIRVGQTLNFSAPQFSDTHSGLKSRELASTPTSNPTKPDKATLQPSLTRPSASWPAGTGPKVAIVGTASLWALVVPCSSKVASHPTLHPAGNS